MIASKNSPDVSVKDYLEGELISSIALCQRMLRRRRAIVIIKMFAERRSLLKPKRFSNQW
ncbi:hypothetical protein [Microcoleus sp. B4-D4]|uniref:hypothetical protein n=1 Tax=Microcoleus sp. B4-D4 TaxID=2818667 RepID=UPI002FD320CA